jgi:predicted phage-related endonuclease
MVKCADCEQEVTVELMDLHRCHVTQQDANGGSTPEANLQVMQVVELTEQDEELLQKYFDFQSQKSAADASRKETLGPLLNKFGGQQFLSFKGQIIGRVVYVEYPSLDVEKLRQEYPDVYEACRTKISTQHYIKRTSRLI